jgi:hypothetical protein
VRWTEQRNFEAVLDMMAAGSLRVQPLISHRFAIADAVSAYDLLANQNPLGVVLRYPAPAPGEAEPAARQVMLTGGSAVAVSSSTPGISVIGAGSYAAQVLLPALKATPAVLRVLVSAGGVSGVHAGKKHGFASTATEAARALEDPQTSAVVIATRHDSHAQYVVRAIEQRKHVFVEKPLAINREQLATIMTAWQAARQDGFEPIVMTGFNRRFAPHVLRMKSNCWPAGPSQSRW